MRHELVFTSAYLRRAKKFLKRHPNLFRQYQRTLELLELNPSHPSLRLHALQGRLAGFHAVSVNLAYRVTIEFMVDGNRILLINVGKHEEVY